MGEKDEMSQSNLYWQSQISYVTFGILLDPNHILIAFILLVIHEQLKQMSGIFSDLLPSPTNCS